MATDGEYELTHIQDRVQAKEEVCDAVYEVAESSEYSVSGRDNKSLSEKQTHSNDAQFEQRALSKEQGVHNVVSEVAEPSEYSVFERNKKFQPGDQTYSNIPAAYKASYQPNDVTVTLDHPKVVKKSDNRRGLIIAVCVGLAICLVISITCIGLLVQERRRNEEGLAASEKKFQDEIFSLKTDMKLQNEVSMKIFLEEIGNLRTDVQSQNESFAEAALLQNKTAILQEINQNLDLYIKNLKKKFSWMTSEVRLRGNGATGSEGRVEILHNGDWGTICHMLGFSRATDAHTIARYGPGSGQIWLNFLACAGTEIWIDACPNIEWGGHNSCEHTQDASVECA